MRCAMRFAEVLFAILMGGAATADEVQMNDNDVRINDTTTNRTVRLVGGVIGQTPGQNLGAKFVEMKPTPGMEFGARFPAHSHTNHETTLMNIIYSAVPF